ncbi:MAG: ABC transporter permease subunit [Candidatus Thermoplasmatota archaeon]|nr:ABC transporter permease subunit [Candidatus Thermoplasmatota archaeon]
MTGVLILVLAVLATAVRVLGLILLSVVSGWFLAYETITNKKFENIFIASIEVFESVPVIAFFPVVLILFVVGIGGSLGVELAVDFLVFTAVVWNIWMGEYQAFKTVPREMVEVTENFRFTFFERLRYLYIPFSVPRIAANIFPSVADGFFYITVSEVFVIGAHTFQVFGIGLYLNQFVLAGQWNDVATLLVILAVVIVIIVVLMREFSRYAVSKFTIDTDMPIVRRGRLNVRESLRSSAVASVNPLNKLAKYNRVRRVSRRVQQDIYYEEKSEKKYGYIPGIIGILLLTFLVYGIYRIVSGVAFSEWIYLFSITPRLLFDLLLDYARVGVIVAVSFVFSIFVGYYLAVNRKAEAAGIPLIESISAYPVPTYFPFIFLAASPFVFSLFGGLTNEVFVLFLGFMSTFYYVFYSFWMGVKAMPSEYSELMKNLNLTFFQKMKLIIMPSTFPYLISGVSSTINSAWGGLMIGEFWPSIIGDKTLTVSNGLMKVIDVATSTGNMDVAAWGSFLFGIIVAVYSILFTRRMMDLARTKYVAEEGIYAA